jgi:hypothetical protein
MKRMESSYVQCAAPRRPLRIFASDPMVGASAPRRITIEINNEPDLQAGPVGDRIQVIDYDGAHNKFFQPVNLNDTAILMQNGLEPTESDPRFHQQMVYAVAMKTLENFDTALGRQLTMTKRGKKLRLFPHAFHGANAFFSSDLHAVLFGYFRADRDNPGQNMPGQNIFTCLSHDIIVHEMTHAIVNRLRKYFLEPSNKDVLAFHEGFADVVALFQHFTYRELLRDEIQRVQADIRRDNTLVRMAQQFGEATGRGRALRSALGKPDLRLNESIIEPHLRGSILVAAVFDAFFAIYQKRISDLIRIATGGTGNLPQGDLHPDLVNRISDEASRTAQMMLTMAIRAFDYLPPVDVTFGDYLRALITADYELFPQDDLGRRVAVINAFRNRGILPRNVPSLAEESLLWEENEKVPDLPVKSPELMEDFLFSAARVSRHMLTPRKAKATPSMPSEPPATPGLREEWTEKDRDVAVGKAVYPILHDWANRNRESLLLHQRLDIQVVGFHPVYRVAPDGRLLIEYVAQFTQRDDTRKKELGGLPFRGGTTIVASVDGRVRYVIAKPIDTGTGAPRVQEAKARYNAQVQYMEATDALDSLFPYAGDEYADNRMALRMNIAALHGGAG